MEILILWGFHSLADYPLQGEFVAKYKAEDKLVLFCHCAIYALVCMMGFMFLHHFFSYEYKNSIESIFFVLIISHFVIDYAKCRYREFLEKYEDISSKEGHSYDVYGFYADQFLHLVVLLCLLLG